MAGENSFAFKNSFSIENLLQGMYKANIFGQWVNYLILFNGWLDGLMV